MTKGFGSDFLDVIENMVKKPVTSSVMTPDMGEEAVEQDARSNVVRKARRTDGDIQGERAVEGLLHAAGVLLERRAELRVRFVGIGHGKGKRTAA